mmetsp:Transcript_65977/g.143111  ORF Transcript_65977/g.143111 Transcript_65977/m.143111 type:complete len:228 (+) Transcript_65977:1519-2202(+)
MARDSLRRIHPKDPGDRGTPGYFGFPLEAFRLLVHLNLAGNCFPCVAEMPRKHTPAVSVLLPRAPSHHEATFPRGVGCEAGLPTALEDVGGHVRLDRRGAWRGLSGYIYDLEPDVSASKPNNSQGTVEYNGCVHKPRGQGIAKEVARVEDDDWGAEKFASCICRLECELRALLTHYQQVVIVKYRDDTNGVQSLPASRPEGSATQRYAAWPNDRPREIPWEKRRLRK